MSGAPIHTVTFTDFSKRRDRRQQGTERRRGERKKERRAADTAGRHTAHAAPPRRSGAPGGAGAAHAPGGAWRLFQPRGPAVPATGGASPTGGHRAASPSAAGRPRLQPPRPVPRGCALHGAAVAAAVAENGKSC